MSKQPSETTPRSAPGTANAPDRRLNAVHDYLDRHVSRSDRGVEIGAFDRPILKRPEWNVLYADVYSTERLLELARNNPRRHVDRVVEVDLPLGEQTLAKAMAGRGIDFVFGSHVFEHIPNLLGFLRDVAVELNDGGRVIGAFPDRRYTFDIDRPRTTLGQLVDRDRQNLSKPDPSAVFDHFYHFKPVKAGQVWHSGNDHGVGRSFTVAQAIEKSRNSLDEYVDAHCNIFGDDEFEAIAAEFVNLGIPLRLDSIFPTSRPMNEFFFCLRKSD